MERPAPTPRTRRIMVTAVAANAPAIIAPQHTAVPISSSLDIKLDSAARGRPANTSLSEMSNVEAICFSLAPENEELVTRLALYNRKPILPAVNQMPPHKFQFLGLIANR